jgi:CBS domain-containing protein
MLLQFLRKTLPFKDLDAYSIDYLSRQWAVDFFPRGTLILEQDVTEVEHLFLVQKGGVKLYVTGSQAPRTLVDFGGEGAAFGASSLVKGRKAEFHVEAVEDTFCFLLDKEVFLKLVRSNPRLSHYYLKSFAEDYMAAAYSELRRDRIHARAQDRLYLFNTEVEELIKGPAEVVAGSMTVQAAAARMASLGIGSLLIHDQAGGVVGIVTDKDLRRKVVAEGRDCSSPVAEIMTSPIQTISPRALCFEAMLQIIRQQVGHLVVKQEDDIKGVITSHDIIVYQGASPLNLFREIASQRKAEDLYLLSQRIPLLVRTMIEEGARATDITRVITLLNGSALSRILWVLTEELGPAPVPFCWLMLGSDGRREQIFRTDQDNALVYADSTDGRLQQEAEGYFSVFAAMATEHLTGCGYPRCKNEFMASNPRWCQPSTVWDGYFSEWISSPDPMEVMQAAIFFDFRAGHGDEKLADTLRERVLEQAQRQPVFQYHLASEYLANYPPLSFFRDAVVEQDGHHSYRLDLKRRGLSPIVNFARLMAVRHGIAATNTGERLDQLAQGSFIPADLYTDSRAAYEFEIQLSLVHQLRQLEAGEMPDTFLNPGELSELERKTLKDAFSVIDRLRVHVKQEFSSVM